MKSSVVKTLVAKSQRKLGLILLSFACLACMPATQAIGQVIPDVKLPAFFSDGMVLQRDKPIKVWGWANAGDIVTASFNDQSASSKTSDEGKWQISFEPMNANSTPSNLDIVDSRDRKLQIKNVLVGEVWFAGGQSNMAFLLRNSSDAAEDIAQSNHPGIRMFLATNTPAAQPKDDIRGKWQVSSSETSGEFSAVAYFFAKRIHEETGVPVGIIKSCWGGKRAEAYTSRKALLSNEHGKQMLAELDELAKKFDSAATEKEYQAAMENWSKRAAKIRADNKDLDEASQKRIPRKPQRAQQVYENARNPTVLYNGMINPFVGYSMRGAIWYQGEANAKPELAGIYQEMFTLMIQDWRNRWQDDFDFYFVQLANYQKPTTEPGIASDWATVQNLQRLTLGLSGTGMATINDVGAANDIHPKDKKTVGNRLALWALKNHYNKQVVVSGPLYQSHTIAGDKVTIKFDHVGGGLRTRDDQPLKRFEITADNKSWHWATATIVEDSIEVSSSDVAKPVAVRYAWAANPEGANLINAEGLPASIFQTTEK